MGAGAWKVFYFPKLVTSEDNDAHAIYHSHYSFRSSPIYAKAKSGKKGNIKLVKSEFLWIKQKSRHIHYQAGERVSERQLFNFYGDLPLAVSFVLSCRQNFTLLSDCGGIFSFASVRVNDNCVQPISEICIWFPIVTFSVSLMDAPRVAIDYDVPVTSRYICTFEKCHNSKL